MPRVAKVASRYPHGTAVKVWVMQPDHGELFLGVWRIYKNTLKGPTHKNPPMSWGVYKSEFLRLNGVPLGPISRVEKAF